MAKSNTTISPQDYSKYNLFFLSGEDTYSRDEVINSIISYFLSNDLKDFNFTQFNEEYCPAEIISTELYALPIMAEKRVVFISQVDKMNTDVQKIILMFLKKKIDSTVLVLSCLKPDKRKSFFKEIGKYKKGKSVEFKAKNEREISIWIKKQLTQKKRNISDSALRLISMNTSNNLANINSELEKLLLYTEDKEHEIDEETIEAVLGISKEFNVFKLINTVVSRNLKSAIKIGNALMKSKENRTDPIGINLLLARTFIAAFQISSLAKQSRININNAAGRLGFNNAWRDGDTLLCANNYSLTELSRIMRYLLECDIKLKSSFQDKQSAIIILFEKIINQAGNKNCQYLDYFNSLRC